MTNLGLHISLFLLPSHLIRSLFVRSHHLPDIDGTTKVNGSLPVYAALLHSCYLKLKDKKSTFAILLRASGPVGSLDQWKLSRASPNLVILNVDEVEQECEAWGERWLSAGSPLSGLAHQYDSMAPGHRLVYITQTASASMVPQPGIRNHIEFIRVDLASLYENDFYILSPVPYANSTGSWALMYTQDGCRDGSILIRYNKGLGNNTVPGEDPHILLTSSSTEETILLGITAASIRATNPRYRGGKLALILSNIHFLGMLKGKKLSEMDMEFWGPPTALTAADQIQDPPISPILATDQIEDPQTPPMPTTDEIEDPPIPILVVDRIPHRLQNSRSVSASLNQVSGNKEHTFVLKLTIDSTGALRWPATARIRNQTDRLSRELGFRSSYISGLN